MQSSMQKGATQCNSVRSSADSCNQCKTMQQLVQLMQNSAKKRAAMAKKTNRRKQGKGVQTGAGQAEDHGSVALGLERRPGAVRLGVAQESGSGEEERESKRLRILLEGTWKEPHSVRASAHVYVYSCGRFA